MATEIVDVPIKNGGSFHSYVKLPEGNYALQLANTPGFRFLSNSLQQKSSQTSSMSPDIFSPNRSHQKSWILHMIFP